MEDQTEIWKTHPDVDSIEVSSLGRVRSVKGHYYKKFPNHAGYLKVHFVMNGKVVYKRVHRLVAETFIPNPDNLPQVNHKDGNRANNNVSNLEWCTASYNAKYREEFGMSRRKPIFAINLSTLKVSWFKSQNEAGRNLGINSGNINNVIVRGRKQTGGYWFVTADDNAVDLTNQKLHEIGKTRLTAADKASAGFVSQVIAE